tara:strand:- start:632 stop:1198 length:567 start_codon:yes stop_codon:yes gene_type:complete
MKIMIIGHSKGIGAACERIFKQDNNEVVGFSRSNGFDFTLDHVRRNIIDNARDCNIIILNAFSDEFRWIQHEMLVDLWHAFENQMKTLIVISSNASDTWKGQMRKYPSYKKLVDHSAKQMAHLNRPLKVINIRPGYVATTRIDASLHEQAMCPDNLARAIKTITELPKDIRPTEVTLLPETHHGKTNN